MRRLLMHFFGALSLDLRTLRHKLAARPSGNKRKARGLWDPTPGSSLRRTIAARLAPKGSAPITTTPRKTWGGRARDHPPRLGRVRSCADGRYTGALRVGGITALAEPRRAHDLPDRRRRRHRCGYAPRRRTAVGDLAPAGGGREPNRRQRQYRRRGRRPLRARRLHHP